MALPIQFKYVRAAAPDIFKLAKLLLLQSKYVSAVALEIFKEQNKKAADEFELILTTQTE